MLTAPGNPETPEKKVLDKNGVELVVGDLVMLPCRVLSAHVGMAYSLITVAPERPSGAHVHTTAMGLNAIQVEKVVPVEAAPAEVTSTEAASDEGDDIGTDEKPTEQ